MSCPVFLAGVRCNPAHELDCPHVGHLLRLVAVLTVGINALTKRGDRKHATSLEFEKRGWETKSVALLSLIGKCESIRSAVDPDHDNELNQAAIFRQFDKDDYYALRSAELIAYAAKTVNEPVERLNQLRQQSRSVDALIHLHKLPAIIKDKEEAMDRQDWKATRTHHEHEVEGQVQGRGVRRRRVILRLGSSGG